MIRFERSRQFSRHMHREAIAYAKEAAQYINNHYPEVSFQVFKGLFDSVETVYWVADLEGLAALEQWLQKLDADNGWHELMNKTPKDLFTEGTAKETVIRLV